MKIYIKKLSSYILLVAMLVALASVPAYAQETSVSDAKYATELLNTLGITDLAYNTDMDAKVSRAEFAVLLTLFANTEVAADISDINFKDVLDGSYEEDYIKTVVSMKYMLPVNNEYFYPAWKITANDAAKAFLMTLGYGNIIADEQNFHSFAKRLDIYDNVDAVNFTRAELYKMMYNALMAKVMDQTGFSEDSPIYEQLSDVNGLYMFHDVIRTRGTITGAGGVILGSGNKSDLKDGYIELDGVKFMCEAHDMSAILGRDVYVYWRDIRASDIDSAIHVEVLDENTLVLAASEIIDYSSFTYEYEEGERTKKYTANKPYVIYNGEEYTGSYTKDIMMPENGDVTIVKADGGRDVIIIRSFTDVHVNFVINDDMSQVILGKNGERYDLSAYDTVAQFYDADGFAMQLSDVKEDSVVSVAKSATGGKYIIYISTEAVSGEIELMSGERWTIGETTYKLSPALEKAINLKAVEMPKFGKQYTFYINCNGEIAFIGDGTSALEDGVFYGVVTGISTGSGFNTDVAIKVFSKAMGGFEIYSVADKLELNGDRKDREKVVEVLKKNGRDGLLGSEFVAQPVKIGLNAENEVNYLMQAASDNDDGLGFFYFMGSSSQDKKGTYYQYRNVLSYSNMGGRDYAAEPNDKNYKQAGYITSTETIQVPFFAPKGDDLIGAIDVDSEKAFISATRPSGDTPFIVYKEDEDDLAAAFVIRAVEAGEKEHCEDTVNIHCILSITERVVDDEVVTCIKTNKMTYYLNDPKIDLNALKVWENYHVEKVGVLVKPYEVNGKQVVHKVVPGDIVNIAADATGFIKAMEIVYDSTNEVMMGKGQCSSDYYGYINTDYVWYSRNTQYNLTLLHVLKIEDGYMSATTAQDPADFIADSSVARHYLGAVPPIICVEKTGNKLSSRNAVNSDLVGYYDSPEDHATVILMHRYAQQQGTSFVIKK